MPMVAVAGSISSEKVTSRTPVSRSKVAAVTVGPEQSRRSSAVVSAP